MMRLFTIAMALSTATSASAGEPGTANACFAPDALKSSPGENIIKRRDHSFDGQADAVTLAPFAPVPAEKRGVIRRVDLPEGEKFIALTFDLCERPGEIAGYDGAIFDYLRREGVKATLFAGGKWMRSHEVRAKQLVADPLFEIANHSDGHRNMKFLDAAAMQSEILGPQRTYGATLARIAARQCLAQPEPDARPERMSLFRFPYGACNQAAVDAVNDAGLLAIQWDASTGDPDKAASARGIAHSMVAEAQPGSILIAHANGRGWNTAEALPLAIPKLKALGYQFVTVSELLAKGKPVIASSCYNARPGDTDRYDFLFAHRGLSKVARIVRTADASKRKQTATRRWRAAAKVRVARTPGGVRKLQYKKS
ncbi:MAG: polysaccharide deacetylase family protein [Hyphomicrobium sp.]